MSQKIGIIGASGFVGSTLCERLYFSGYRNFIPFVRSTGNAWRVARLPVQIGTVDLRDPRQVRDAVAMCDTIVNCALPNDDLRGQGLRNLANACRKRGLQRFVHLSSILIYGRDPRSDSTTETGEPRPGDNPYGVMKLRDERMILDLHGSGVPCYILCPGNIGGPYSPFMHALAQRLARGPLPLVDGGAYASNIVHVDNLVEAILAAIRADRGAGERYFVNETQPVPWRQLFEDLARLLSLPAQFVEVTRERVVPFLHTPSQPLGLAGHVKIALSGEFRTALSRMPMFAAMNSMAANLFARLPQKQQLRIRERVQWPIRFPRPQAEPALDDRYVTVQARRYYHSTEKLQKTLGWKPLLDYRAGLESTSQWLKFANAVTSG